MKPRTLILICIIIWCILIMIADAINYWTDYGRMTIIWH